MKSSIVVSDTAPRHPIRVVAQRTGLTPATIRAWERRYEAVTPSRSEGGQRLYSDRDVKRLGMLRKLSEMGRQISTVAKLSDEAAGSLLIEDRTAADAARVPAANGSGPSARIDRAYEDLQRFDGDGLSRTLWLAAMALGARVFLDDVVAPLLARVGAGWVMGEISPAQEHMGSEVIDRVLERLAPTPSTEGPSLVVATLPGERHRLGARLAATAATLEGWDVSYLGSDLPVAEIAAAARAVGARAVAISVVSNDQLAETTRSLGALRQLLDPEVEILVGGGAAELLDVQHLPGGLKVFSRVDELPAPPDRSRTAPGT